VSFGSQMGFCLARECVTILFIREAPGSVIGPETEFSERGLS
jgi:hypothetical protein